jgi:transcriptional regulator with XRE-family HTH domain
MRTTLNRIPTPEGAVLRFFRFARGVSEGAFASMAGVGLHAAGRWENGTVPLSRDRLVELLALLGVPPEAVDAALFAHRLGSRPEPESQEPLPEAERRIVSQAAVAGGRAGTEAARRELTIDRLHRRAARHAAWAAGVWSRVKGFSARQQSAVVRVLQGDERSWALAVRLCAASVDAAAHGAGESLRLARLARGLAAKDPARRGGACACSDFASRS